MLLHRLHRSTVRHSRFVVTFALLLLLQSTVLGRLPVYDFFGDTRTDFTFINIGAAGTPLVWWTLRNPGLPGPNQAFIRQATFGLSGDSINPGDFFGDGKTEISFWRNGVFYPMPFNDGSNSPSVIRFGTTGDNIGRDGDYDGYGKLDASVIRIVGSQLNWYYHGSAGADRTVPFGRTQAGNSLLAFRGVDFTGDNRDELVVATVETATGVVTWWIGDSVTGALLLQV